MAVKGKKRKAANNSAAKSAAKKTKKALTPTDINNYEALIKSSKQNANHIVTLINCIKENRGRSSQSALRVAATQALRRVFNHASEKGDLVLSNKAIATTKNAAIEKYQKWLKSLFEKYTSLLLASMDEDDVGLQLSSVHALMDAIKIECMGKQRGTTMTTGILSKVSARILRGHSCDITCRFVCTYTCMNVSNTLICAMCAYVRTRDWDW